MPTISVSCLNGSVSARRSGMIDRLRLRLRQKVRQRRERFVQPPDDGAVVLRLDRGDARIEGCADLVAFQPSLQRRNAVLRADRRAVVKQHPLAQRHDPALAVIVDHIAGQHLRLRSVAPCRARTTSRKPSANSCASRWRRWRAGRARSNLSAAQKPAICFAGDRRTSQRAVAAAPAMKLRLLMERFPGECLFMCVGPYAGRDGRTAVGFPVSRRRVYR